MWLAVGLLVVADLFVPRADGADSHRLDATDFEACGPACVYMACVDRGVSPAWRDLIARCGPRADGETSFDDLRRVGLAYGLNPMAAVVTPELLPQIPLPAIAQLSGTSGKLDHFVLIISVLGDDLLYIDPPVMTRMEAVGDFRRRWTGAVLAFPGSAVEADQFDRALRWFAWRPYVEAGLTSTLVAMLLIPFYGCRQRHGGSPTRTMAASTGIALNVNRTALRPMALACAAAFAVLCAVWAVRFADAHWPYPRFAIDSEQVDIGLLKLGKNEFTVCVRNEGLKALEIERVVASCTCTRVEGCSAIAPGAAGVIKGEVNVAPGAGSSELRVFTNEVDGLHTVRLSWFGEQPPYVIPSRIGISLKPGERVKRRIEIFNATRDDFILTGVDGLSNDRGFLVDIAKAPAEAHASGLGIAARALRGRTRSFSLDVSVTAPAAPADLQIQPVLLFASPNMEYKQPLRLQLTMPRRFDARPRHVFIGASSIGSLNGRSARVFLSSDSRLPNFAITSRPDFLDCTLTRLGLREARLEITVNSAVGDFSGEWSHSAITVDDGHGRTLAVPVTIIFPNVAESERGDINGPSESAR